MIIQFVVRDDFIPVTGVVGSPVLLIQLIVEMAFAVTCILRIVFFDAEILLYVFPVKYIFKIGHQRPEKVKDNYQQVEYTIVLNPHYL